jgi:hypothetical protein
VSKVPTTRARPPGRTTQITRLSLRLLLSGAVVNAVLGPAPQSGIAAGGNVFDDTAVPCVIAGRDNSMRPLPYLLH